MKIRGCCGDIQHNNITSSFAPVSILECSFLVQGIWQEFYDLCGWQSAQSCRYGTSEAERYFLAVSGEIIVIGGYDNTAVQITTSKKALLRADRNRSGFVGIIRNQGNLDDLGSE